MRDELVLHVVTKQHE